MDISYYYSFTTKILLSQLMGKKPNEKEHIFPQATKITVTAFAKKSTFAGKLSGRTFLS